MSGHWRFILASLATLAALAATLSLGLWQLSRAQEKLALQAAQVQQARLPPLSVAQLLGAAEPDALLHRRALLQGRWLASATVHLENRQMNGRPGFFLVTPLKLEPSGPVILVLRGWAPRDFQDRTALPPVATPSGPVQVAGVVTAPLSRLYDFAGAQQGPIRQNLDMASYSVELSQPLFGLVLRQQGDLPDGLLRQWPQADLGVDKHRGYAAQWFALAALVGGFYLWFQIVRPLRSRR